MFKWEGINRYTSFAYLDLFTAHNFIVLSSEAERICLPSGVNATDRTAAWWPFQNVLSPVILGIQTANEPSLLHDAMRFPVGEKDTSFSPEVCPVNLYFKNFFSFLSVEIYIYI